MGLKRYLGAEGFLRALQGAYAELEAQREKINHLNVFPVPDGDTGSNMCLTLSAALKEVEGAYRPGAAVGELAQLAARGSLWGARGNSGVILSQFMRGWAEGLAGCHTASPDDVVQALHRAVDTAYRAVMEPVEGTMLSVGKGAALAAQEARSRLDDVPAILAGALAGARRSLEATPTQLEVLRKAGVVDAGGAGLVAMLEGALQGLERVRAELAAVALPSEPDHRAERAATPGVAAVLSAPAAGVGNGRLEASRREVSAQGLTFKYCTEFILKGTDLPQDRLQQALAELGDSVLVVGDESVLKIHLHTDRPGRALEIAVEFGDLSAIQISNMEEQVNEMIRKDHPAALVAVAPGAGLADVFRSLGASHVVIGGQTANPSVEELVEAIRAVDSPHVVLLPNNRNVILAAQRAAELVMEKQTRVVPSTTVPQGVAAALAFHPVVPGESPSAFDELARSMEEAMAAVRSGEVTVAARDFADNGRTAKAGDFIGLSDEGLLAVGDDREEVVCQLVTQLGGFQAELITLYYGAEVEAACAEGLVARLERLFPGAEVEVYAGGQPHYPYLISVE